jgi:hypothetical protein
VQDLSSAEGANVQGIVLEDGYVLPPPPAAEMLGVWRDKAKLVVSKGAPLPDRCVKCNGPAPGPKLKKKYTWHHPIFFILIFAGLLVYFIVAMFVRKTATVELGLCDEHMAKHHRNIWVTLLLILLGVGGFILALVVGENSFLLVGILLILAGIIYGVTVLKIVTPVKIDKEFAWLKGVDKNYLAGLPQWPGV